MPDDQLPAQIVPAARFLTAAEFHRLADVPPEGIVRPEEFRTVTRAHVIAWRDDMVRRKLGGSTVRHRLAALAALFEYLCDCNAVTHNPVKGAVHPNNFEQIVW